MIKPNELRCGNYVYVDIPTLRNDEFFNDKVFAIIKMVSEDRVDVQYENNGREILILDKLIQIPLTSEWLLKFGFAQSEPAFYNIELPYWVRNGVCLLYNRPPKNTYLIAKFSYENIFFASQLRWIDNVHNLQNIYYALTGEELTIKE